MVHRSTNPANSESFTSYPPGSVYVEFDVDASRVSPGGRSDWGIVSGPGSYLDRLNQARGGEPITDMPRAYNIVLVREG